MTLTTFDTMMISCPDLRDDVRRDQRVSTEKSAISDPDLNLLTAIGNGDARALASLMERHSGWALRFAERLSGDHQAAEEVVQSAFLKLWNKPELFEGRSLFKTWFYRVVHNLSMDALRRRRPNQTELDDTLEDEQPGPEQRLATGQRSEQVRLALDTLPERQRQAIVLSHFEGLTQAEASALMEISEGALESLLSRGRANLRKCLAGTLN